MCLWLAVNGNNNTLQSTNITDSCLSVMVAMVAFEKGLDGPLGPGASYVEEVGVPLI
jgi:hypothetical protein